jgi:regulator of replication initiation timing
MSEANQGVSDAAETSQSESQVNQANNVEAGGHNIDGLVKHKEKLLGENKKLKSEMAELRRLVESSQQEKLQAEGKKDELIAALKKEKDELSKKVVGTHSAFAMRVISGELKAEAAKQGCVALEDFVRLIDLNDIEVDDNYNPDPEKVKALVQDAVRSKPYLFSKAGPNVNTKLPNGESVPEPKREDLSKLSAKELLELAHARAKLKKG